MHYLHDQIVHSRLHFHTITIYKTTLNRAIDDQRHWENENTDDLKYGFLECISAEMSLLNECFEQHDVSDQSFQAHSQAVYPQRLKTAR